MDYLQQVQQGIDYIEAHLQEELELAEVARQAGLSQWHFQRIFKALTNETLKTYIRSRRLAHAMHLLLHSNERILDIALSAGYEAQESFSRAFKAAFMLTPNEFRRIGNQCPFLIKPAFNVEYLSHINNNLMLEPEIIEQPALQLVGLKTRFYSIDSDKNNIGELLPPLWDEFLARLAEVSGSIGGECYGVVQPTSDNSDLLEYHAAIAVQKIGTLPVGMSSLVIPACRYARFTHRGQPMQLNSTVDYIYSNWLMQSGPQHSGGADLEYYGDDYAADSDESIIRYAVPLA